MSRIMKEPIRVLHVLQRMEAAGVQTLLMSIYRKMDRSKVQFDFLVHRDFEADYDKEIENQNPDFGVMIFDINYLKETNDKYGHDFGNKLISCAAGIISGIFKRSPVFRIGGDEFLVILQNRDLEEYENLVAKFDEECKNNSIQAGEKNIPISIAKGFARYDSFKDSKFVDVFNRADDAMYANKREIKELK